MAETVQEIREAYYTYEEPIGSQSVGTLLAEIDRLERQVADMAKCNARNSNLHSVYVRAEAVCKKAEALHTCIQQEGYRRWNGLNNPGLTELFNALKTYLAGKQEQDDGE